MLLAATHPERNGCAGHLWLLRQADLESRLSMGTHAGGTRQGKYEQVEANGATRWTSRNYIPSKMHDREFARRLATYYRNAASPSAAVALLRMNTQIDVRDVLPTIGVPTLVLHRTGDLDVNIEEGRGLRHKSPVLASWNCRVTSTCPGAATRTPFSTKSRNSLRASEPRAIDRELQPCCSRTS